MFESRLQVAQVFMAASFILTAIGILTLIFGSIVVGVFCIVLAHASSAAGCYFHAEVKAYPPLIGIPIGVAFGVMGGLIMYVLPDEAKETPMELERRLAREGIENARRRDKGYEVLDDDDDY
jgi:hypothetical protein